MVKPEGEYKSSYMSDEDCGSSTRQRGHVHKEIGGGKGLGGTETYSEHYWWY